MWRGGHTAPAGGSRSRRTLMARVSTATRAAAHRSGPGLVHSADAAADHPRTDLGGPQTAARGVQPSPTCRREGRRGLDLEERDDAQDHRCDRGLPARRAAGRHPGRGRPRRRARRGPEPSGDRRRLGSADRSRPRSRHRGPAEAQARHLARRPRRAGARRPLPDRRGPQGPRPAVPHPGRRPHQPGPDRRRARPGRRLRRAAAQGRTAATGAARSSTTSPAPRSTAPSGCRRRSSRPATR